MSRDTGYTPGGGASTTTVALEEPTEKQRAWVLRLEQLLGELEELEREGRRLRAARLDAPEAVMLRWLVQHMREGVDALDVAREESKPLEITRDERGCRTLVIGKRSSTVIDITSRR